MKKNIPWISPIPAAGCLPFALCNGMITTSAVDNCSLDTSLCDGALFDTGASFCLFLLTPGLLMIFLLMYFRLTMAACFWTCCWKLMAFHMCDCVRFHLILSSTVAYWLVNKATSKQQPSSLSCVSSTPFQVALAPERHWSGRFLQHPLQVALCGATRLCSGETLGRLPGKWTKTHQKTPIYPIYMDVSKRKTGFCNCCK